MKKYLIQIPILFCLLEASSQNLVPNGNFETLSSCITGPTAINTAIPWYNPNGTSTSGYFNACAPGSGSSVPCQAGCFYYQFPHSGVGMAAAECGSIAVADYRDYIQVQLTNPLINNKCYYVEFYTNHANENGGGYAVNNIGAYISTTPISCAIQHPLNLTPQILLPGNPVISDTINWIKVYGAYQAIGGEDYITIGNFNYDTNTTFQLMGTLNYVPEAYYYFDDVSINEIGKPNVGVDTTICLGDSVQLGINNYEGLQYEWQPTAGLSNAGIANPYAKPSITTTYILQQTSPCGILKDTVVVTIGGCTVAVEESNKTPSFKLYPNPSSGEFTLELDLKTNDKVTIEVYNLLGEKVLEQKVNGMTGKNKYQIDLTKTTDGIYFVTTHFGNESLFAKIIKN